MKTVLITGAAGNLGRATVAKFLSAGYHVIATHSPGKPSSLSPHQHLEAYPVDLTDEKAVAATLDTILTKHSAIDAALLLAGGFAMGAIDKTDGAAFRKMLTLNFETAFFTARPLVAQMKKQSTGGRIVLVGSRTALRPHDGKNALAYALAKSLLLNLAEYLNADADKHNVVTSVVVPSTIDTPDNRRAMPNADFSTWVSPDEIADTLHFITESPSLREPVVKIYGKA